MAALSTVFYSRGYRSAFSGFAMSRWVSYPLHDVSDMPECPCVYVIYCGPHPMYVGQTRFPPSRMKAHARLIDCDNYKDGSRAFVASWGYCPCELGLTVKIRPERKYGEALMAEARLIKALGTSGNKRKRAA